MNVQLIEKNGKPEWAVIPCSEYEKLCEALDNAEDIKDIETNLQAIHSESANQGQVLKNKIYSISSAEFWGLLPNYCCKCLNHPKTLKLRVYLLFSSPRRSPWAANFFKSRRAVWVEALPYKIEFEYLSESSEACTHRHGPCPRHTQVHFCIFRAHYFHQADRGLWLREVYK